LKPLVFLAVTIFSLAACNKELGDDFTAGFSGKYQTIKTVDLKPMVMYVQNRQITDPAIINPYLSRHGYSSYFSTASTQTITDTILAITFGNNDSVNFRAKYGPEIYSGIIIKNTPAEWALQRTDTLLFLFDPYPPSSFFRCDTLESMVPRHKPFVSYIFFPGSSGPAAIQKRVPSFPIQIVNGGLTVPMVTVACNSVWSYPTSSGNCKIVIYDQYNINKDNFENSLFQQDTIVVQEKTLKMVKIQ